MTDTNLPVAGCRPAIVHWTDTTSPVGWHELAELDGDTCIIRSCAWVLPLGTRDGHLSIAQDVDPDGRVNGVTHIPLPMLRRIDYLNDPLAG